jgi:hypothetical protein
MYSYSSADGLFQKPEYLDNRRQPRGISTQMAISHEEPTSPTDPNRGLNVKVFMIVVAIAAIVVAVLLFLTVWSGGHKAMPEPTKTSPPASSRLTAPAIRLKPSPLHPVTLQASSSSRPSHLR